MTYGWVNYAKGIGIILVVYGHVMRGLYNAGLLSNALLFNFLDKVIYSFHMPLFFFISGLFFVQSIERRGVVGLVNSKIKTIAYPYFLWIVIQFLVSYLFNGLTNTDVKLESLYSIFWRPFDHFWFLYALFLVFSVYSLIYKVNNSVIFILSLSFLAYFFKGYLYVPWGIFNSVFTFGIYFCLGMLFNKYFLMPNDFSKIFLIAISLVFFFMQWYFFGFLELGYVSSYVTLILASVSIFFIVTFSGFLFDVNLKFVQYLGLYSLEIYLLHIIFSSGFRIVLQAFFHVDLEVVHIVGGTLMGILCPIIFVLFVNKFRIPFLFRI